MNVPVLPTPSLRGCAGREYDFFIKTEVQNMLARKLCARHVELLIMKPEIFVLYIGPLGSLLVCYQLKPRLIGLLLSTIIRDNSYIKLHTLCCHTHNTQSKEGEEQTCR